MGDSSISNPFGRIFSEEETDAFKEADESRGEIESREEIEPREAKASSESPPGINDCAKAANSFFPWVELMGVSMPNYLESTRYTFPSTTAVGMSKAKEPMAAAV